MASNRTPSRRNAQQSYATETKKLAGKRFAAVILQPISDTLPPNPIAPIAQPVRLLHHFGFEPRQHRDSGSRRPSVRNSCSFASIISVRAIASDANAQRAGRAALALRLPHRVQ